MMESLEATGETGGMAAATKLLDTMIVQSRMASPIESPTFLKKIGDFISDKLKEMVAGNREGREEFGETFIGMLVKNNFLSPESGENVKAYMANSAGSGILASVAILMSLLLSFMKISGEVMAGDFVKHMNSKFTPNFLDVASLSKALHVAPELTSEINKKLAENGLAEDDIKLLKISNYALYDVMQIRECFLRGIITKEKMVERLGEHGFTPERIAEITATWNVIPGPQDLFWMVGKEAFEPDQIAQFGLGAEFPVEQVKWLNQQGISEEWAIKYWVAHWDYPSEGRVLELYHRGLIDDKTLDSFYRVIEMPPFWREKLKKSVVLVIY